MTDQWIAAYCRSHDHLRFAKVCGLPELEIAVTSHVYFRVRLCFPAPASIFIGRVACLISQFDRDDYF